MSMSVCFTVVDGEILHENRGGVEHFYVPDPLGNTAALVDKSGTVTDIYTYWPSGEVQSRTGSSITKFTFIGTQGYFLDEADQVYVRARYYSPTVMQWISADPFWPDEPPYVYVESKFVALIDKSGLGPGRPVFNGGIWNDPSIQPFNNCYNYACQNPAGNFMQPGGAFPLFDNFPGGSPSCKNIILNAISDGATPTNSRFPTGCPLGAHKICVYVTNSSSGFTDYHWYRQDKNGTWSDKPGNGPATNCLYGTTVPIKNPGSDARLRGYPIKCGCLCAKNRSGVL